MNLHTILRAALAALAIQLSCAQEQGGKTVALQFLAFPPHPDLKPIELLISEKKTMPIEIPGHQLSPTYKVQGLTSIVVGTTTLNEKQEPVFQVLGKADALASTQQIVLLLRKGKENSDGFMVLPIDGDLDKFSGGNYFFINAASMPVGGQIGDKTFALKPGQRKLVQPQATHAAGGCQVTLSYQKQEKWKTFYDTRWSVNKKYRNLVFFYQDPESGSLGVAPIMEMLR